jgi:hypothetical protein
MCYKSPDQPSVLESQKTVVAQATISVVKSAKCPKKSGLLLPSTHTFVPTIMTTPTNTPTEGLTQLSTPYYTHPSATPSIHPSTHLYLSLSSHASAPLPIQPCTQPPLRSSTANVTGSQNVPNLHIVTSASSPNTSSRLASPYSLQQPSLHPYRHTFRYLLHLAC